MQSACLWFKHINPHNESNKFGSKPKNTIIDNINSVYLNENIRLVNN